MNRNKIILTFGFVLLYLQSYSQGGIWTWVNGVNNLNSTGSFGIKGVPNLINYPPGRYQAGQWIDLNGNLWIFGGEGNNNENNDLWEYKTATNEWTWVNGPSTSMGAGVYGTQGIPGPNNVPGARSWGATCWTDQSGHLWLHAGRGYDQLGNYLGLDDMWMYDIPSNQWTWMKGHNVGPAYPPVYGVLQVADASNTPGERIETNTAWVKSDSSLWFFGGQSYGINSIGDSYNDVWEFDINTNNWIWMSGIQGNNNSYSYGAKNIESASNLPPGRFTYTKWQDDNDNFYIFGGLGNDAYNDVWKYNSHNNRWTWIGGSSNPNDGGQYTSTCTPDNMVVPTARFENRTAQMPGNSGILWTFGGQINSDAYNDLWNFNTQTNEWTWVSGSATPNPSGDYGSINIGAASNVPPPRSGMCLWIDQSGVQWMFGGVCLSTTNPSFFSDLWKFEPDTTCARSYNNTSDTFAMPNAFSPNSDGKNDLFYPVFTNLNSASVASFMIYNRWGQLVYDDPTKGWDGRYNGEEQPGGVYCYFITVHAPGNTQGQAKDIIKQGSFMLFR